MRHLKASQFKPSCGYWNFSSITNHEYDNIKIPIIQRQNVSQFWRKKFICIWKQFVFKTEKLYSSSIWLLTTTKQANRLVYSKSTQNLINFENWWTPRSAGYPRTLKSKMDCMFKRNSEWNLNKVSRIFTRL